MVVIRADRELRHGVVAQLLDCVVQSGLTAVLASRASAPQLFAVLCHRG